MESSAVTPDEARRIASTHEEKNRFLTTSTALRSLAHQIEVLESKVATWELETDAVRQNELLAAEVKRLKQLVADSAFPQRGAIVRTQVIRRMLAACAKECQEQKAMTEEAFMAEAQCSWSDAKTGRWS